MFAIPDKHLSPLTSLTQSVHGKTATLTKLLLSLKVAPLDEQGTLFNGAGLLFNNHENHWSTL